LSHRIWLAVGSFASLGLSASIATIAGVPIIELDHHVQTVPSRPPSQRLPVLIALAAGTLLFGLTGEPQGPASPVDEAKVCSSFGASSGSSGETIVFNAENVEILRIPHCPV
jgi:hypothetical protein